MSLHVEANKYAATFHDAQVTAQGSDSPLEVPAAVTVSYSEGALDTMIGLSPVDGKMVLHVDTNAEPLRAIYVNDQLVYGADAGDDDAGEGAGETVRMIDLRISILQSQIDAGLDRPTENQYSARIRDLTATKNRLMAVKAFANTLTDTERLAR